MKLLFTGKGTSGSWQIRGVQLGEALGARVEPMSSRGADLAIGVKRVPDALAFALRGRLIWDVVDAYPQPQGNNWGEQGCKHWLGREVKRIEPIGFIAATQAMARDLEGFGKPVLWLPHHYRPGIARNPIRKEVKVIGYEGGLGYVREWQADIDRACQRIGAQFVMNPSNLAEVDIVLALRGSSGYAPRKWKSNVKLANAHGSGTPFIGSPEAGYIEMMSGPEYWAETPMQLDICIGHLMSQERRVHVQERFLKSAFSLEQAASQLKAWLAKF